MIRVKSFRGSKGPEEQPGQAGRNEQDIHSRTPQAIALALSAAALYLKSFLPGSHGAALAGEPVPGPEKGRDMPAPARTASAVVGDRQDGDAANGEPPPEAQTTAAAMRVSSPRPPKVWLGEDAGAGLGGPPGPAALGGTPANLDLPLPSLPGRGWILPSDDTIYFPGQSMGLAGPGRGARGQGTESGGWAPPTDGGTDTSGPGNPGGGGDGPAWGGGDDPAPGDQTGTGAPDPYAHPAGTPATGGRNRAPRNSGPVYLADVGAGASLTIALSSLLGASEDDDGDSLSVTAVTASRGTVTATEGGWIFSPGEGGPGQAEIRYTVSDGQASVSQVAHVSVTAGNTVPDTGPDIIVGTLGEDEIVGGAGGSLISALDGSDIIIGGPGDDQIIAGSGNDVVHAGRGNDTVLGGTGHDRLHGGDGNDRLSGNEGSDVLSGDAGDDVLSGDAGDDALDGGAGDDLLQGGDGQDSLAGGAGQDTLDGGAGDDLIQGGSGDDLIADGAGRDTVDGGEGDDLVLAAADGADDILAGGNGLDTLDASASIESVIFDLARGVVEGAALGSDAVSGFEVFVGGEGDDVFIAAPSDATFVGGAGDDQFVFKSATLSASAAELRFQILDFASGDRISLESLGFFQSGNDSESDLMKDLYKSLREYDFGDSRPRLRLTDAESDGVERTLIEIDFNRDNVYETTISVEGSHLLVMVMDS